MARILLEDTSAQKALALANRNLAAVPGTGIGAPAGTGIGPVNTPALPKPPVTAVASNYALPSPETTARATPYELPKPATTAPAAPAVQAPTPTRPILTLTQGNIPNANARLQSPAASAFAQAAPTGTPAPATTPGAPAGLPPPANAVPKVAIPQGPTIYSATGQPGSAANPQYAQEVQREIDRLAKLRAAGGAGAVPNTPRVAGSPAPGMASRAFSTIGKYGTKLLQGGAKLMPMLNMGVQTFDAYNDIATEGMTTTDQWARGAEAVGRLAGGGAGSIVGATAGLAGGPYAPVTVPAGAVLGGIIGNYAPRATLEASNWIFGADNELPSDKAARLRQQQTDEFAAARNEALRTPEQVAERQAMIDEAIQQGRPQNVLDAISSGEIPQRTRAPAPTIEQRAAANEVATQKVQERRGQTASPASAALSNQPPAQQATSSPEKYAEISGYDGPKKNVNRRYSLEELTKLGERNVIPSANFTNPGAGVLLSEASGGKFNLGAGAANPITQYKREVESAQARNRATYERATAAQQQSQQQGRGTPDSTVQRLMSDAESALNSGRKRKAAGLTDLIRAYSGATQAGGAANAMAQKQQQPTENEQALAALQLQKEGSNAEIMQIQAAQAKRASDLQAALLSASPEDQPAIKAQLDAVTGRQTQQAKPDPGAVSARDQYANYGRLAAAEFDPDKKAELLAKQQQFAPGGTSPPVPGAQLAGDGNWYVIQNGKYVPVSK